MGAVVIIGGTSGIGLDMAKHYLTRGRPVVLTGRDPERTEKVAAEVNALCAPPGSDARATGLAVDLNQPHDVAAALASTGQVDRLALVAIERDLNTIVDYNIDKAIRLTTLKLVGYHAVAAALRTRLSPNGSVLIFGGMAKDRPYAGSTTVSTINAGVVGMTRTLAVELAPLRVNSLHTWMIEDSPFWRDKPERQEYARNCTLTGRLSTSAEVVEAAIFLLENGAVNAVDLRVDGGLRTG
ncbi:SDR family oxidoreductase [Dactylosporangium sp. NPDC005572]|uniref:SDR family oxidoreductase n=1 Tax=Dactylosporangium sp. NPDC005572 TaxID=3156889 RepID=UPI0033B5E407